MRVSACSYFNKTNTHTHSHIDRHTQTQAGPVKEAHVQSCRQLVACATAACSALTRTHICLVSSRLVLSRSLARRTRRNQNRSSSHCACPYPCPFSAPAPCTDLLLLLPPQLQLQLLKVTLIDV